MKKLPLSKKGWKNRDKYEALVDDDVFDEVNQYDWHYNYTRDKNDGYARNSKTNIYLHVYIWKLKNGDIPDNFEIEHWDGNKLNCQISNLRLATKSENSCNKEKYKNNKSGFKCICKQTQKGHPRKDGTYKIYTRWYVVITKNHKRYSNYFPYTEEGLQDAIEWYKQKSLELHKEFSIYNRPDENK
jgi:hypothetical protein